MYEGEDVRVVDGIIRARRMYGIDGVGHFGEQMVEGRLVESGALGVEGDGGEVVNEDGFEVWQVWDRRGGRNENCGGRLGEVGGDFEAMGAKFRGDFAVFESVVAQEGGGFTHASTFARWVAKIEGNLTDIGG